MIDTSSIRNTPRTPAINFHLKDVTRSRRRHRRQKRTRDLEKQLIKQGKLPVRASKAARRKAKKAREEAGGITEYTLFTPVALSDITFHGRPSHQHRGHRRNARPRMPKRGFTQQRVSPPQVVIKDGSSEKVLTTTSFEAVRGRLHALRRFKKQLDHTQGDPGEGLHSAEEDQEDDGMIEQILNEKHQDIQAAEKDVGDMLLDDEDGDLALPPPAMDLPEEAESMTSSKRRRQKRLRDRQRYMSDVPLTPRVQMAMATEFSRGFEVSSPNRTFSPNLPTHTEDVLRESLDISARPMTRELSSDTPIILDHANLGSKDGSIQTKVPSSPDDSERKGDHGDRNAAWWLDVSCPTYRDMTELSKMFPLHPLTVEDVLQQEPREKVEIFERLGYYFVVVRAIDEKYFRYSSVSSDEVNSQTSSLTQKDDDYKVEKGDSLEMQEVKKDSSNSYDNLQEGQRSPRRKMRVDIVEGVDGKEGVEGVSVGAINIYLVVFSHGIISFHFEDISKHTDRVRSRLVDLAQPVELTSDWIAHGLFDSIIDAYFPLLAYIETEVRDFERFTSDPLHMPSISSGIRKSAKKGKGDQVIGVEGTGELDHDTMLPMRYAHESNKVTVLRILPRMELGSFSRKIFPESMMEQRVKVSRFRIHEGGKEVIPSAVRKFLQMGEAKGQSTAFLSNSAQKQNAMLRHITETRKITMGLARILQPKNDAVRALRKRLVEMRGNSLAQEEMSIYMGDVHDHIVSLLTQLSSDEIRLGDIHSSYLTSIRINNHRVRQKVDRSLVVLVAVGTTVMSTVWSISIFGQNVTVPKNNIESSMYHWFIGICIGALIIPAIMITRTYTWMRAARKRAIANRARR